MCKKILVLLMALTLLIVSTGCTPAQKDVYETFYDYMYVDPETGEFVDPETFVPNIEQEEDESEIELEDSLITEDNESEDNKSTEPIVVKVSDFGAKGDGVTDDAKAIYSAQMSSLILILTLKEKFRQYLRQIIKI